MATKRDGNERSCNECGITSQCVAPVPTIAEYSAEAIRVSETATSACTQPFDMRLAIASSGTPAIALMRPTLIDVRTTS